MGSGEAETCQGGNKGIKCLMSFLGGSRECVQSRAFGVRGTRR